MKEYTPEEARARNVMYRHLAEAQRCASTLDEELMKNHFFLAEKAVRGDEKAGRLLYMYTSNIRKHFDIRRDLRKEALDEAVRCAYEGDRDSMLAYVKEAGSYRILSFREQGILARALAESEEADPKAKTKEIFVGADDETREIILIDTD